MIARLLYAAVALCILGTRPERVAPPAAPATRDAVPAASAVTACPGGFPAGVAVPGDFAIPRIQR